MVSHINVAVDDDVAERARRVKDQRDLNWAEFIEEATRLFEDMDNSNGGDNDRS